MKKIVLIAVVLFFVIALAVYLSAPPEPIGWIKYLVHSGDTICEIAISMTPDGEDYRYTKYSIIKKNNIKNAMIYPGQTILVPIYD